MNRYLSILSYQGWKKILAAVMIGLFAVSMQTATVSAKNQKSKVILYVPHDNRPISDEETVDAAQKTGVVVKVPPDQLLGDRATNGDTDGLYKWIMDNAQSADAAVISSDSLLYGGLTSSRKHNFDKADILERADRFNEIHRKYPKLPLYVFSSIMRTPKSAAASGTEEPEYYQTYGSSIFQYTALLDKDISEGLTKDEQNQLITIRSSIPQDVLNDWMGRRRKNFDANSALIELARNDVTSYLVLGCDDNAPYSQTHLESVYLAKSARDLSADKFHIVAGVDELGLLLITRAINELNDYKPVVAIDYADGYGGATIPLYSGEPIDNSVRTEVYLAGGIPTTSTERAAMVMLVNTNVSGCTYEAGENVNSIYPRANTNSFADMIEQYINMKIPVAVGDIAYANGSDNALMRVLLKKGLLFKLNSYAGWNTATNSTGWAIAQGILSLHMNTDDKNKLLMTRYINDWIYQANVRQEVARAFNIFPGRGTRLALGDKVEPAQIEAQKMTKEFFDQYLSFLHIKAVKVDFPWNRLFEADIQISQNPDEYVKRYFNSYK